MTRHAPAPTPATVPEGAQDRAKLAAALTAVTLVEDGMTLGLGTGSTAEIMVRALAARARRDRLALRCVATSERTAALAASLGLPVVGLDEAGPIAMTIDGTDEIDPEFRLIKGGGGAHLREKIVAAASARLVVIADAGKAVARLGAFPLPVEITRFGEARSRAAIAVVLAAQGLADRPIGLRPGRDGAPFVTDEGNLIVDCHLGAIAAPEALDAALCAIPGVVATGLFLGLCATAILGHGDGRAEIRMLGRGPGWRVVDLAAAAAELPESRAEEMP